jgi:hypothetical protein
MPNNSRNDPTPQELGFPQQAIPDPGALPPNRGLPSVPPYLSFAQLVNSFSRSFLNYDEALRQGRDQALAIRRDPVLMQALRARQMPVAQLEWHIAPDDPNDMQQAQTAEAMQRAIKRMPRLQAFLMCLLEAAWYGRSACQIAWQWDWVDGVKVCRPRQWWPVNGDKLVFKFDGTPGLLVHHNFQGDWVPTERGRTHFLNANERTALVIHHFEPEDADYYDGELASGLFGVGIRSRIYWYWYIKTQTMQYLMDYLERVGSGGVTVYYYEAGNPQSLEEVRQAAENQFKNNTILFPRYRESPNTGPGIDRFEPSQGGVQLVQQLVTQYFDDVMRKFILGQDLTATAEPTGLGSGVAALHGQTFSRIISYDAISLAESLTQDLVRPMQRFMGKAHLPPCRFVFEVDAPNTSTILGAAQAFYQMGGSVDEESLREALGLPSPEPGKPILSQQQQMSPQAAGTIPAGVPMQGPPGPDPTQQGLVQPGMEQQAAAPMPGAVA